MSSDSPTAGAALAARYFDGQTSRLYHVTLSVRDGVAVLAGDIERSCPLGELRVSERSSHAVRKVSFPDGAYLEIADQAAFNDMLHDTGHRDGWVVRLQQSWRGALLATVATIVALWLSYQYLLPLAAKGIAYALPQSVERQLGQGVLDFLDSHVFEASKLAGTRQQALRAQFARLATPGDSTPAHRIVFRKSKIGPNAFALPSGGIVLTDEMIELLPDDQAIMGVLVAHVQGQSVPLVPLRLLLHDEGDEKLSFADKADLTGAQQVLVVNYNNRRLGLLVDRFIRQQNIVIKPLSKPLDTIDLFGGVTLLGSGQVCLVLEVPALTRLFLTKRP